MQEDIVALYVDNYRSIAKKFIFKAPIINRAVAMIYTMENKKVDLDQLQYCISIINNNTKWYSFFRGPMMTIIAALLSLKENKEKTFKAIAEVYEQLKKAGFRSNYYLTIVAYLVVANSEEFDRKSIINKAWAVYRGMAANHRWLTSWPHYLYAVLYALSEFDISMSLKAGEKYLNELKSKFASRCGVHRLSLVLALGSEKIGLHEKVFFLYNILKEQKFNFDSIYQLPFLGLFADLSEDETSIYALFRKNYDNLSQVKEFSKYFIGKWEMMVLISCLSVCDASNQKSGFYVKRQEIVLILLLIMVIALMNSK